MGRQMIWPQIKKLEFAVYGVKDYVALKDVYYKNDYKVPAGFVFDGASIPMFTSWLFTENDRKKGIKASAFHDYACEQRNISRKEATEMLVDLWKEAGLGDRWYTSFKPFLVGLGVNLYQRFVKGWK